MNLGVFFFLWFFFYNVSDSFSFFHCKDPVANHSLCQKQQPSFQVSPQPARFTALLNWVGLEEKVTVSSKGTILFPWKGRLLLNHAICTLHLDNVFKTCHKPTSRLLFPFKHLLHLENLPIFYLLCDIQREWAAQYVPGTTQISAQPACRDAAQVG